MEKCGVGSDTVLGQACRRIPGSGKESCYLEQDAQGTPTERLDSLGNFVKRQGNCPFQADVLDDIRQRKIEE